MIYRYIKLVSISRLCRVIFNLYKYTCECQICHPLRGLHAPGRKFNQCKSPSSTTLAPSPHSFCGRSVTATSLTPMSTCNPILCWSDGLLMMTLARLSSLVCAPASERVSCVVDRFMHAHIYVVCTCTYTHFTERCKPSATMNMRC